MSDPAEVFIQYLFDTYKQLKEIIQSFHQCSKTENGYLVDSEVQAINFDKLTQWIYKKNYPKSVDSMTLSGDHICLIEFKSGNQKVHKEKLIKDVSEKIDKSDELIFEKICPKAFPKGEECCSLRFFLVIEEKDVNAVPILAETLIKLSTADVQNKYSYLVPDLKKNILKPDHFDKVDVWYSSLFDLYLEKYDIKCIENPRYQ